MYREEIERYYSDSKIRKILLEISENREVVPTLFNGNFGTRPNAIYYDKDIEQFLKQGATSFHGSVERWSNPLNLKKDMHKEEFDALRIGWDLVIDLDCKTNLDDAKIAALSIVNMLEKYDIYDYSIKFSGNRGFHIGVPFEVFPNEILGVGNTEQNFPRIPKTVVDYINYYIEKDLRKAYGKDPSEVLTLDSGVISQRHLFRFPYCLHQKTWLVSLPIKKEEVRDFEKETAKVENVKVGESFLSKHVKEGSGIELLRSALYWGRKPKKETEKVVFRGIQLPKTALGTEHFPPCMHNILHGIEDGRKRSVFVLIAFLHRVGWTKEGIWNLLVKWNEKNKPPLKESFLKTTMNGQFTNQEPRMAPNCDNANYYRDYNVCKPDDFCKIIKNPVSYSLKRVSNLRKPGKRKKKQVNKSREI